MGWTQIEVGTNGFNTTTDDITDIVDLQTQSNIINQNLELGENKFALVFHELIVLEELSLKEGATILIDGGSYNDLDIGIIIPFSGKYNPDLYSRGFFPCDGRLLEIKSYPDLFRVLGFKFGRDSYGSQFALPNLKGRVISGLDIKSTDFYPIGKTDGVDKVVLTIDEMPRHRHYLNRNLGGEGYNTYHHYQFYTSGDANRPTSYEGGDEPHTNMPPVLFLNFLIKYNKQ